MYDQPWFLSYQMSYDMILLPPAEALYSAWVNMDSNLNCADSADNLQWSSNSQATDFATTKSLDRYKLVKKWYAVS